MTKRTHIIVSIALFLLLGITQNTVAQADWNTAGNSIISTDFIGTTNTLPLILRTANTVTPQPIIFQTDGSNERMRITQSGNLGIGAITAPVKITISANGGISSGYHSWMDIGTFLNASDGMTSYEDLNYFGMKDETGLGGHNDAVVGWGGGPSISTSHPMFLRFIFSTTAEPSGVETDAEIARMSFTGNVGIGNFYNPSSITAINEPARRLEVLDGGRNEPQFRLTHTQNTNYALGIHTDFQTTSTGDLFINPRNAGNNTNVGVSISAPQNRVHVNSNDNAQTFLQFSNQSGTGVTASDGFRIGVPATSSTNLEAQINQRENDRLSIYTNNFERIRITHIGALNNNVAFNPGSLASGLTRIGISHSTASPVTRPLSLLHLGYNVANATSNDGWRPWMDVGMFISQNSDNVYLGMKSEDNGSDAVLSWGDNSDNPDNFKMVFTIPQSGLALPSATANGLEALRMTPTLTTVNTGIGGDAGNGNPYFGSSTNPTATLEVNSWGATNVTGGSSGLRFTNLNTTTPRASNPGLGILSVNANGDVIYVRENQALDIGNYCNADPRPIADHFEMLLDGLSYSFIAGANDNSTVNIGNITCGTAMPARLYVQQSEEMPGVPFHTAIAGVTDGNNLPDLMEVYGVMGFISGARSYQHAGVYGNSVVAQNDFFSPQTEGVGVWGTASFNNRNIGVKGIATEGNGADLNIGIYGEAANAETASYAGFFEGDVFFNGIVEGSQFGWTSDSIFKIAVDTIANPISIINQLKPKTYFYDTLNIHNLHFPSKKQYGFIAQEVEQILPELVDQVYKPAVYDTTGTETAPSVSYKNMNYNALFGITVAALQKQQAQITERDSLITTLFKRLRRLERCVVDANLCGNPNNVSYKQDESEEANINRQDIELKNPQSIVLDQNVPNPFAEKTVIGYALPDDVKSATIIFHNAEGKEINRAEINTRGRGEVNVYAQDLSSGVYTYTLVADGKVVDTKRMVRK